MKICLKFREINILFIFQFQAEIIEDEIADVNDDKTDQVNFVPKYFVNLKFHVKFREIDFL